MTAAILHLDAAPDEKGCVRVYPASHELGPPTAFGQDHHVDPDQSPVSAAVPIEARAGDLPIFNYMLVHGSRVNVSDDPRTTWLQVRDPEDGPISKQRQSRGQRMILGGIDPRWPALRFAWKDETAR